MKGTEASPHVSVAEALARLGDEPKRFRQLFQHGSLEVEIYAPRGADPQTPHRRDEVYVVISGSGTFVEGDARRAFQPGDFIFVPAGKPHRFEHFSADFATWVFFYGPDGGEPPDREATERASP
jgi:mannose-6-phosphate isomerase-like protein (cupin superfamily)